VTRVGLALLVALGLPGCPLSIEPSEFDSANSSSPVGEPCKVDQDCRVGACIDTQPGGYCSAPCSNSVPCPSGSRCVEVDFFGIKNASCWRDCETHEECGRPGYLCMVPPDGGDRVCAGRTH
jgi:hypothetical protein